MAVERLFGVEFVKQGLMQSALRQSAMSAPSVGPAAAPAVMPAVAVAVGQQDVDRQRAYNTYVAPVLQTLAAHSDQALDERGLFKEVAKTVEKSDFRDFRLALTELDARRYVEAVERNEFGDPQYRITQLGLSVTPAIA